MEPWAWECLVGAISTSAHVHKLQSVPLNQWGPQQVTQVCVCVYVNVYVCMCMCVCVFVHVD